MRYDAFISYRHSDLDTYVAKKVHKRLETFKVPGSVAKKYGKKKIKRVFRDQEELPIGSDLNNNIESALAESEYLIVICSPRTPGSEWVNKEIETFIAMHGREHVLAVLIEGEPDESFPSLLLKDENGNNVEPLAADVRGADRVELNRKFKTEIIRLAAPILGCSYDELKQRHRERFIKKVVALASLVAGLAIAFGVYNAYNAKLISDNYQEKLINQSKFFADTADRVYEAGDRRAAALIALEALPENDDRPYVAAAQRALANSLNLYSIGAEYMNDALLSHDALVCGAVLNEDGSLAASYDSCSNIYLWDTNSDTIINKKSTRVIEDKNEVKVFDIKISGETTIVFDNCGAYALDKDFNELWSYNLDNAIIGQLSLDKTMMAIGNVHHIAILDLTSGELVSELNNDKLNFNNKLCFNLDNTRFAVAFSDIQDKNSTGVYTYNLKSKKTITNTMPYPFVSAVCFGADNNVYASFREVYETSGNTRLVAFKEEDEKWHVDIAIPDIYYESYSRLAYSDYSDTVVYCNGNEIFFYSPESGEERFKVNTVGKIAEMGLSTTTPYVVTLLQTGQLQLINYEKQGIGAKQLLDVNSTASSFAMNNGVALVYHTLSSDLYVLKMKKDDDVENIYSFENSIAAVLANDKNDKYTVVAGDSLYTFDSNNQLKWEAKLPEENIYNGWFYAGNTFVACTDKGLTVYDGDSGEEHTCKVEEDFKISIEGWNYNSETNKLAFFFLNKYVIFDLDNYSFGKINSVGDTSLSLWLSEDEGVAYGIVDRRLSIIDLKTNEARHFGPDECTAASSLVENKSLFVSNDGTKLLLACEDNKLRVVNIESEEVENSVDFKFDSSYFMRISNDNKYLIMQGIDKKLRTYDLEADTYTYVSNCEYVEFKNMQELDNGYFILVSSHEMLVFNENYELVNDIYYGKALLKSTDKVLLAASKELYVSDYLSLEQMIKRAKEEFGDTQLTEEEKIRYNID